jgi:hypothetical protein
MLVHLEADIPHCDTTNIILPPSHKEKSTLFWERLQFHFFENLKLLEVIVA